MQNTSCIKKMKLNPNTKSVNSMRVKKEDKPKIIKPILIDDVPITEYCKNHCSVSSFSEPQWFINPYDCSVIDEKQRKSFLPRSRESCKFKTCLNNNHPPKDWINLDVFQTYTNTESKTITAFIGSHAYALEWLPLPWFANDDYSNSEFILVASIGEEGGFDDYEDKNFIEKDDLSRLRNRKGLLQIWKLQEENFAIECCFAMNYGLVWSIEACKGGSSYSKSGQRLSLIAISFDDGFIRIFSLPFPSSLRPCKLTPPIYTLAPLVLLHPPFSSHTVCKCISWSWTDSQRYLVAGYGNGTINYFDLQTKSSLFSILDKESNIRQMKYIQSWLGHGAIVTAIQILPIKGSNIIISGSWDRKIKLWNISEYPVISLIVIHRSVVNCIHTSPLWLSGAFISFESSFLSSNQSTICYKPLIEENSSSENRTFCSITCDSANVYSMSMSYFFNSFLFSDSVGNVILQNGFKPRYKKKSEKKHADVLPVFVTQLLPLIKNESESDDRLLIKRENKRERSYKDITSKYGLLFNDFIFEPNDIKAVEILTILTKLKKARLTDYPLSSVNKSLWSPNKFSAHLLVNLIHSGFVRISNMKSIIQFSLNSTSKKTTTNEKPKSKRGRKPKHIEKESLN